MYIIQYKKTFIQITIQKSKKWVLKTMLNNLKGV